MKVNVQMPWIIPMNKILKKNNQSEPGPVLFVFLNLNYTVLEFRYEFVIKNH